MREQLIDLTGKTFGHWTVEGKGGRTAYGKLLWQCRCACGARRELKGQALRTGRSKSCGCQVNVTHGLTRRNGGNTNYNRWASMISRCFDEQDKKYKNYGGRGITVCDRWRFGEDGKTGVECYAADIGQPPFDGATIDRRDNDGNYEPGNCRWATMAEQNQNKRVPNGRAIA